MPVDKKTYMDQRYAAQRRFFLSLLGDRCKKCKATSRLEIDHIDPSKKTIKLGSLKTRRTIVAAIIELVEKCQILCHACHVKKSSLEQSSRPVSFTHGTLYGWLKAKCDCPVCVEAKWKWHDERNKRRRKRAEPYATRRKLTAP